MAVQQFEFDLRTKEWLPPLKQGGFPSDAIQNRFEATWNAIFSTSDRIPTDGSVKIEVAFSKEENINSGQLVETFASFLKRVLRKCVRVETSPDKGFYLACERFAFEQDDKLSPLAHVDLTELLVGGNVFTLEREYSPATVNFIESARKHEAAARSLLFKRFSDDVKSDLKQISNRRFSNDEPGNRESADVVASVHKQALASGGVLTYRNTPVFLRREQPPVELEGNSVISICRFDNGELIKSGTHVPTLGVIKKVDVAEPMIGDAEISRQVEVEALRRQLVELMGQRAGSPLAAAEIRNRVNEWKARLKAALGYVHDGEFTKVVLATGKSSFQLKRTAGETRENSFNR